jgi:hypothetical protein
MTGRGVKRVQVAVACVCRVGVAPEASELPRKPGKDHKHSESLKLVVVPLKIDKVPKNNAKVHSESVSPLPPRNQRFVNVNAGVHLTHFYAPMFQLCIHFNVLCLEGIAIVFGQQTFCVCSKMCEDES